MIMCSMVPEQDKKHTCNSATRKREATKKQAAGGGCTATRGRGLVRQQFLW